MHATVILNDFVAGRRTIITLEAEDYAFVQAQWEIPDQILADLQSHPFYAGRRRWCDLDPGHYRYMIVLTIIRVAELEDAERGDAENAVVRSLHFLICALIHCIQTRSESIIELIRFNRVGESEVTYDFSASLNMEIDPRKPVTGLKMVIDNT